MRSDDQQEYHNEWTQWTVGGGGRIRTSFLPICGGYKVDTEANQYIHGAMPPEIYDALFVLTAVFTQIKILNYIGFGVMVPFN